MPTKNGQKGPHLQPVNYGLTESGRFANWTWQGERSVIQQLIPGVEALGGVWTLQESFTGGADTLVAKFAVVPGETEVPVSEWELFAAMSEKDILEADNPAINSLSRTEKRDIEHALDNDTEPTLDQNADIVYEVYDLMLSKFRSVIVAQPILRHTQTVSRNYQIPSSFSNLKRIISTSTLGSTEDIPSNILSQLPLELSFNNKLVYGWYKLHPTVRVAARRRVQIEQEWHYGLWSRLIYGDAL
jgi:hypothetical protein